MAELVARNHDGTIYCDPLLREVVEAIARQAIGVDAAGVDAALAALAASVNTALSELASSHIVAALPPAPAPITLAPEIRVTPTIEVQPAEVAVHLPARRTTTTVKRDPATGLVQSSESVEVDTQ